MRVGGTLWEEVEKADSVIQRSSTRLVKTTKDKYKLLFNKLNP